MKTEPHPAGLPGPASPRRRSPWRFLLALLALWAVAAYLVVPWASKKYFHRHAEFTASPRITQTADGHPGDPLNIALVGTPSELVRALTAAGWHPADALTFKSSVRIAVDTVFRKPDVAAPVSSLYLFRRIQDFAFELPVGDSPRQRHHVRFWRWDQLEDGRPVWMGAATFDERVGLSHANGQITHHIGPDVDAERDLIATGLEKAGWALQERWIDGFHPVLEGRNGGGDLWRTDGRLRVVILRVDQE